MKICIICQKRFEPEKHHPHAQTCSKHCSKKWEYVRNREKYLKPKKSYVSRKCDYCGNEYYPKRFDQVYCNRTCSRAGYNLQRKKHTLVEKSCLYCNKKFVPDKRHPQARFCEEACNKAYNFQHKYKKNKFNWYTKKYCRNCGNLIILNQSNRLNTQLIRKYCCKKCRNSAAHKRFKHFNRKGYKEKIKRRKSTQKYKELHRIEVKIRKADIKANTEHEFKPIDWLHKRNEHNGFCALCKKYVGGDKLQMDHIFPLAEAKKYFKRTGKKWTYTLAGVQPLCGSCNNKKSDNLV